jgi:hypothetical protein
MHANPTTKIGKMKTPLKMQVEKSANMAMRSASTCVHHSNLIPTVPLLVATTTQPGESSFHIATIHANLAFARAVGELPIPS